MQGTHHSKVEPLMPYMVIHDITTDPHLLGWCSATQWNTWLVLACGAKHDATLNDMCCGFSGCQHRAHAVMEVRIRLRNAVVRSCSVADGCRNGWFCVQSLGRLIILSTEILTVLSQQVVKIYKKSQKCCKMCRAGHESGLPMDHYRYTHGKTCGYENSWVWVTGDHRSTWICVLVMVLQVLAMSTCKDLAPIFHPVSFYLNNVCTCKYY